MYKKFRVFPLLLAFSLFVTALSSCGKTAVGDSEKIIEKAKKKTYKAEYIQSENFSKEYKTGDGVVSYVLSVTYPVLSDEAPLTVKQSINSLMQYRLELYQSDAQTNVENAAEYMKNNSTSTPWSMNVTYKIEFVSDTFLSFTLDEKYSTAGKDVSPSTIAFNYNLSTGEQVDAREFIPFSSNEDEVLSAVKQHIKTRLKTEKSYLADEDTLNKMTEGIFDKGRFLINNDFVTFLVPVSRFNIGMYGTWRVEM
nr:hypothetical protein [Clostridiales bacterium]